MSCFVDAKASGGIWQYRTDCSIYNLIDLRTQVAEIDYLIKR